MKNFFIITLFIVFSGFTSASYAENLTFGSSTYIGEVKKGKAHGEGTVTFADGSKYQGKFKRNQINGKGKYTDSNGNVFEGKWRKGKFKNKIDKKTREIIILNLNTGTEYSFEIKGKGRVSSKWFEAEKTSSGTYELTAKGKRDMDKAIEAAANSSEGEGSGGGSGGSGGGCGG